MFKVTKLPIFLVLILMLLMYVIDAADIAFKYGFKYQGIISLMIFLTGTVVIMIGVHTFNKAKTTVNPITPEKSTMLVKTGIYSYSRNPMYIGFLAWLLADALFIGNPLNLLLLLLFIGLANKLYIQPEEKALENIFATEFKEYKNAVRRWI